MNKKLKQKRWIAPPFPGEAPSGGFVGGIQDPEVAQRLVNVVTGFEHLQAHLVNVLAPLLGTADQTVAGVVLHAFRSASARRDFLLHLLHRSPGNTGFGDDFEDIIQSFTTLSEKRNHLVHGLWWTHEETGRTYLAPSDEYGLTLAKAKLVKLDDLEWFIHHTTYLMLRLMTFQPSAGVKG